MEKMHSHHIQAENASPLKVIAWEITRRCHLKCIHCRGAARDQMYDGELSTDEIKKILENVSSKAKPLLILTGGEPMYREDVYDISKFAISLGMQVVMSPCGSLIDDNACQKMKESGIRRVSISIDSAQPITHDSFRGVPGIFEKTLKGIEILKHNGIEFQINTTVSTININELPEILAFVKKIGAAAFNPFFLVPSGRGAAIKEFELTPEQYEQALIWLTNQAISDPFPIRTTCAPHHNRIMRSKNFSLEMGQMAKMAPPKGCLGGKEFVFISHTGDLQPCGFFDVPCGNIRNAGYNFWKLYDSERVFLDIRDRSKYTGKCGRCAFLNVCGGCRARALALHGSYLDEEPYCLFQP